MSTHQYTYICLAGTYVQKYSHMIDNYLARTRKHHHNSQDPVSCLTRYPLSALFFFLRDRCTRTPGAGFCMCIVWISGLGTQSPLYAADSPQHTNYRILCLYSSGLGALSSDCDMTILFNFYNFFSILRTTFVALLLRMLVNMFVNANQWLFSELSYIQ